MLSDSVGSYVTHFQQKFPYGWLKKKNKSQKFPLGATEKCEDNWIIWDSTETNLWREKKNPLLHYQKDSVLEFPSQIFPAVGVASGFNPLKHSVVYIPLPYVLYINITHL